VNEGDKHGNLDSVLVYVVVIVFDVTIILRLFMCTDICFGGI